MSLSTYVRPDRSLTRYTRYTCGQQLDVSCILESYCCCLFVSLFIFLSLQFSNIYIFVTLFSGSVTPTKLILGTHVDNVLTYCVNQNQTDAAYSSLYFIFLSHFQILKRLSGTMRPTKSRLGTHMDNGLMYCVYQNQVGTTYLSFIHFSFSPIFKN